jgi:hypothetical protein
VFEGIGGADGAGGAGGGGGTIEDADEGGRVVCEVSAFGSVLSVTEVFPGVAGTLGDE